MPKSKLGPDPVDVIVGRNVRNLRNQRKLSQEALGDALGMTFQQIQKYEKGTNRIASSNLVKIAQRLDVSLMTLFHGVDAETEDQVGNAVTGQILSLSPKAFQVGRLWDQHNATVKRSVLALLEAIKHDEDAEGEEPRQQRA